MQGYRKRLTGRPRGCQVGQLLGHDGDSCRANELGDDGVSGEGIACFVCGRIYPVFTPDMLGVIGRILEGDTAPGFPQAPEVTIGAENMLDTDKRPDLQVEEFARAYPSADLRSLVRLVFSYRPYGLQSAEIYYLARGGPESTTDDKTMGADFRQQTWRGVPANLLAVAQVLSTFDFRCVNQPGVTSRISLRRGSSRDGLILPRVKVELVAQGDSEMQLV